MKNKLKNKKFFKEKLPLYYYLLRNNNTPFFAKVIIIALVIYILSPLDIVPDTIPFLGLVDDLALLPLTSLIVSNIVPEDVIGDSEDKTRKLWFNSKKYIIFKIIAISILIIIAIILIRNLISK